MRDRGTSLIGRALMYALMIIVTPSYSYIAGSLASSELDMVNEIRTKEFVFQINL